MNRIVTNFLYVLFAITAVVSMWTASGKAIASQPLTPWDLAMVTAAPAAALAAILTGVLNKWRMQWLTFCSALAVGMIAGFLATFVSGIFHFAARVTVPFDLIFGAVVGVVYALDAVKRLQTTQVASGG